MSISTPAPPQSESVTRKPYTNAPRDMYWVFTEKGAAIHQTHTGAVVLDNPYRVPSEWVNDELVVLEALE